MSCWILKRNSMLVKCLHQKPIDKSTTLNLVIRALVFRCHRRLVFFRPTWRRMRLSTELRADLRSLVKPPRLPRQPAASPPCRLAAGSDDGHCLREDDLCDGDEDWQRGSQVVQKRPFHATQLPESQSSGRQGGEGEDGKKKKRWPFYSRPKRSNQAWRALQKTISPN